MNNPKHLSAYLSYYLPLHASESAWIWHQIESRQLIRRPLKSWIDVGCGPGTASLGLLAAMKEAPQSIQLVDLSARALKVASQLVGELSPSSTIKTTTTRLEALRPRVPADLILASHVFNEMGSGPRLRDKKLRALETLLSLGAEDSVLIIIEPAKREPTFDLMWIRDQICEEHRILAPCPGGTRFCPMLRARAGWCYAEPLTSVPWPESWKNALMKIGIQKESAPFSYLVIQKSPPPSPNKAIHKVALTDTSRTRGLYCTGQRLSPGSRVPHRGAWVDNHKVKD
jgi:ribosomal protein RSM22 (predicted rRNA methylase)